VSSGPCGATDSRPQIMRPISRCLCFCVDDRPPSFAQRFRKASGPAVERPLAGDVVDAAASTPIPRRWCPRALVVQARAPTERAAPPWRRSRNLLLTLNHGSSAAFQRWSRPTSPPFAKKSRLPDHVTRPTQQTPPFSREQFPSPRPPLGASPAAHNPGLLEHRGCPVPMNSFFHL